MKTEQVIIVAVAICAFLSFYFSFLSFTATEDSLKKQFVLLAVYSLISGIVVFSFLLTYVLMRKVLIEHPSFNVIQSN